MKKLILFLLLSTFSSASYSSWQLYSMEWCEPDITNHYNACLVNAIAAACMVEPYPNGYACADGSPWQQVVYSPVDPCTAPEVWDQDNQQCSPPPLDCSVLQPTDLTFSLSELPVPLTLNVGGCGYTTGDLTACSGGDGNWLCLSKATPTGLPSEPNDYTPPVSTTNPLPPTPPNEPLNPTTTTETTPLVPGTNPIGEPTTQQTTTEETTTPPQQNVVVKDAVIEIIRVDGTRVTKTTTTITTTKTNGSVKREIVTEYTQAPQTTTTISVPRQSGTPTTTTSTIPGSEGSTTETTTTNPDGSSTSESSSEDDGKPDEFPKIEQKGKNQYDGLLDDSGLDDIIEGLGNDDPGLFDFSSPMSNMSGSCQSISSSWRGNTFTFPGANGCSLLNELKDILAFVLYVLTAYSIFEIAIRRPA